MAPSAQEATVMMGSFSLIASRTPPAQYDGSTPEFQRRGQKGGGDYGTPPMQHTNRAMRKTSETLPITGIVGMKRRKVTYST